MENNEPEKAEAEVSRLQARIAEAAQKKKWNTVKRLQYLLTHSYYAKALAVRKVTANEGKNTRAWTMNCGKRQ